jgi:hypothetical protein
MLTASRVLRMPATSACAGSAIRPGGCHDLWILASGKLKQCWLAEDQIVQGVPCMAAGGFLTAIFHHGGFSTNFFENGKRRSCTLFKNFGGQRRGELIMQAA